MNNPPAMHREMLASTVQFSRDNQALEPHQHPPDTTHAQRQHDQQETTHPTTTPPPTPATGMDTQAKPRQDTRPATTTHPPHTTRDKPTAPAAPGPSGPNSVPSIPPSHQDRFPHQQDEPPERNPTHQPYSHPTATATRHHVDVPPSSPTLDTHGRESGTHKPTRKQEVC